MIGFNFYPKSKRYLSEPINDENTPGCHNVGVFVNPGIAEVNKMASLHDLSYVQLHGNESVDFCREVVKNHKMIKVFGVDEDFNFSEVHPYETYADYFLFDTKTPLYGGSGKKFRWEKLAEYNGQTKFLLSGGIQPEDAEEIAKLEHKRFAGVDINSGFESSPGIKDIDTIKSFLNKIKHEESGQ